ncbi:MAG: hydantoinase/oxoprolinase family protein [Rhodospirillaceae bacterium]|nr:hydantoinase/oxoprolinase family protein [Rhodospirillaceae bacterium]
MKFRVGIDIGGTFTDIALLGDDGTMRNCKVLTTPDDFGRAIATGLAALMATHGIAADAIARVVHATTVATNAILENKGARTGLVTTKGFRDVLEMRRLRIPEMYTLDYPKPPPLVPRRLRLEVDERLGPRGEVRRALDEAGAKAAARRLADAGVESVAIALIHAYANPAHEKRVAEIVAEALPDAFVTCSSDILPEIREYERTSTTVINAFLGPTLKRYFASLTRHLAAIGVTAPIDIMKSDGGVMSLRLAAERPAYLVESGPAAGVIGAAKLDARTGDGSGGRDCLTLDMGGTTAKASIVEGGQVARTGDYEVGAGINLSSKLVMGGGYALKLPVIDISEIGAGGGSIVSIDKGGLLHVGPESAGAMPGPVAYDRGGTEPTFTDAVTTLGYLNPEGLVGGDLKLAADKARAALEQKVAMPLGRATLDTAYGIFQVACGTMVRAVKAVSTYRGRDPRDFALFAFGGNGPVVAAALADLLDMKEVIVPPQPGVFSAVGLLLSDIEQERSRAFLKRFAAADPAEIARAYAELETAILADLAADGYARERVALSRVADLRYAGQAHELQVPYTETAAGAPDFAAMAAAFAAEHTRTYGHAAESEAVECVALRIKGRVMAERAPHIDPMAGRAPARSAAQLAAGRKRLAYFGPGVGAIDVPVVTRTSLRAAAQAGPLIVEEYDSTCVVPPGWVATLDDAANIRLVRE